MRVRYLVIFIIAACLALWIGVATGALSNAAYFLIFGITTEGDTLDPVILLGLHAMLLLLVGYILGYTSGYWCGLAKRYLSKTPQQKTEPKKEAPNTANPVPKTKKSKQKQPKQFVNLKKYYVSFLAKIIALFTITRSFTQNIVPKVKKSWQKTKPNLIKFAHLTFKACIRVLDFIFSIIERIWLWFRP
ncbi:MAG: hypothetical protein PVI21_01240 [Candidatus Woesebacteria bacterium]|jgi:hypothetical protein